MQKLGGTTPKKTQSLMVLGYFSGKIGKILEKLGAQLPPCPPTLPPLHFVIGTIRKPRGQKFGIF